MCETLSSSSCSVLSPGKSLLTKRNTLLKVREHLISAYKLWIIPHLCTITQRHETRVSSNLYEMFFSFYHNSSLVLCLAAIVPLLHYQGLKLKSHHELQHRRRPGLKTNLFIIIENHLRLQVPVTGLEMKCHVSK